MRMRRAVLAIAQAQECCNWPVVRSVSKLVPPEQFRWIAKLFPTEYRLLVHDQEVGYMQTDPLLLCYF